MHIAIDDTYGPEIDSQSTLVTGKRRTHLAVVFKDTEVDSLRAQIKECLHELSKGSTIPLDEFHFSDILNRRNFWAQRTDNVNLKIIEFFAERYKEHRWPVFIQTVDDRTFEDHKVDISRYGKLGGIDFTKREDQSLFFLLVKLKKAYLDSAQPIQLYIDQGRASPGTSFLSLFFQDWPDDSKGLYCSSSDEPLLQIADFLAFVVNRSTYLTSTKGTLTDTDLWLLKLVHDMEIDCKELVRCQSTMPELRNDFDQMHAEDRRSKGIDFPT